MVLVGVVSVLVGLVVLAGGVLVAFWLRQTPYAHPRSAHLFQSARDCSLFATRLQPLLRVSLALRPWGLLGVCLWWGLVFLAGLRFCAIDSL